MLVISFLGLLCLVSVLENQARNKFDSTDRDCTSLIAQTGTALV